MTLITKVEFLIASSASLAVHGISDTYFQLNLIPIPSDSAYVHSGARANVLCKRPDSNSVGEPLEPGAQFNGITKILKNFPSLVYTMT